MRQDEIEEMRCLPLFAGVSATHVDAMLKASFLQRFPAHVELAREGDQADFLHVIVDGQIEMYSAYRERETTISVIGPGHSFIVAAVILDRIYLKSARSLLPSRVLLVPAEAVRQYFSEDATFARALALELAGAYRGVVRELKNQKLRSSLERLANWILTHDRETGGKGRFELPFDKKVLASRLGMAPEVLSRSIAALIPYGVLVSGRIVKIADRGALNSLACPSPTIDDTICV
jgi:CRP/FNR family transcriptional activator FtrB